jgi:thiopurine S-methyltransferase
MNNILNKDYWETSYSNKQTGWDIGSCSTPLKSYFDQLTDKNLRILIPGAGNAYEAEYLHLLGFKNVLVIDIAKAPLDNLLKRCPNFPKENLIQNDFFKLKFRVDLIVEQTFFCALNPDLRSFYAQKAADLLVNGGKLVGVFFNREFDFEGPPFGGRKEEYMPYFTPYFSKVKFEDCYNSIKPREGTEVFAVLNK